VNYPANPRTRTQKPEALMTICGHYSSSAGQLSPRRGPAFTRSLPASPFGSEAALISILDIYSHFSFPHSYSHWSIVNLYNHMFCIYHVSLLDNFILFRSQEKRRSAAYRTKMASGQGMACTCFPHRPRSLLPSPIPAHASVRQLCPSMLLSSNRLERG
jgi:hypothetical protein